MTTLERARENAAAISFRQLLLFHTVARLGSISRAAADHGLTQPAVTQTLATLARRAGFSVLERGGRGVTLTAQGRELHARSSLLLERLERALDGIGCSSSQDIIWRLSHVQLRALRAVGEHGTLERAFVLLAQTQRSVRRAIHLLEIRLDQPLLAQEKGGTTLSAAGRLFTRQVGYMADELDWIIDDVRDSAGQAARTIVIGVAPDPGTASLNDVIKIFIREHPTWCLEVVEAAQDDLLARLMVGEVSVVVGHVPPAADDLIAWEEVAATAYHVVARHDHPLAGRSPISVRDLAAYAWVFGARGSQRRIASDLLFAGLPQPSCVAVTSAAPMLAQLLTDSDLLGLLTGRELAVRRERLEALSFDFRAATSRLGVAVRPDYSPGSTQTHLGSGLIGHSQKMTVAAR